MRAREGHPEATVDGSAPVKSLPSGEPAVGTDTLLLRVLRKGSERRKGRPLTEAELAELEARVQRVRKAGVYVPRQADVSEAVRAAVDALPRVLPGTLRLPGVRRRDLLRGGRLDARGRRQVGRAIEDVGVLLQRALRAGHVGPQLPAYARRSTSLFVQQEDFDAFIPDGWGAQFPAEAGALGRAMGLPPRAIPLLCILQWASAARPALSSDCHGCGAGFQVSLDWLARKLGCTRTWVQALLNRLDPYAAWRRACREVARQNRRRARTGEVPLGAPPKPRGTAYIHRLRQLRRYEDTCPEASRRRLWVDTKGRHHLHVDVRGLTYLTSAGRRVLGRPRAPLEAASELAHLGERALRYVTGRLARGHDLFRGLRPGEALRARRELLATPGVPQDLPPKKQTPADFPGARNAGLEEGGTP